MSDFVKFVIVTTVNEGLHWFDQFVQFIKTVIAWVNTVQSETD